MRYSSRVVAFVLVPIFFAALLSAPNNARSEEDDDDPNELEIVSGHVNFLAAEQPEPRRLPYVGESYRKLISPATTDAQITTIFGRRERGAVEKKLLAGEFYTYLEINNYFNDDAITKKCANSTESWAIALGLNITYRGTKGAPEVLFLPPSVILSDYNNKNEKEPVAPGCTFKSFPITQTGPYLLYSDFDARQGEYVLHFDVAKSTSDAPSDIAMFAKMFLAVAGVFKGFTLPVGVDVALPTVSGTLDTLIDRNRSFVWNVQYSAVLTAVRQADLKKGERPSYKKNRPHEQVTGYYLKIRSPYIDTKNELADPKANFLEIYQGRSASFIVDGMKAKQITPEDILQRDALNVPHTCFPGVGSCGKDVPTFAKAVADLAGIAPQTEKFSDLNRKSIISACQKIRDTASDLGFSKIDALLVRWALLQRSGLFKTLDTTTQRIDQCWSENDTKKLQAITSALGKDFIPSDPL